MEGCEAANQSDYKWSTMFRRLVDTFGSYLFSRSMTVNSCECERLVKGSVFPTRVIPKGLLAGIGSFTHPDRHDRQLETQ